MKKHYFTAIFHPEEKGYWVEFQDLDGCFTQGETLEEAVQMATDALYAWFTPIDGEPSKDIPIPTVPSQDKLVDGAFIMVIEFDPIRAAKLNNKKAVKKTLTIPAWLDEIAKNNRINYSQTLQQALIEKLGLE